MALKIGPSYKAYRNSGTYGTPTWNLCDGLTDVDADAEYLEGDASIRAIAYELTEPVLAKLEFSFDMPHDPAQDDYDDFRDAFNNKTVLDMLFLDGAQATPGSEGWRAEVKLTQKKNPQKLKDVGRVQCVAKPCYTTNAGPSWYTAA